MNPGSRAAPARKGEAEKIVWPAFHFLALSFAVWLVSPLIVITPSDYMVRNSYGLRLAAGLLIFILYVGKWTFDVLAPQGLAAKVSRLRTFALVVFIFLVVSFLIFIVSQAAALYLQTGINQDKANSTDSLTASGDPLSAGKRPFPPSRPAVRQEGDLAEIHV